jgi:endonuclease G
MDEQMCIAAASLRVAARAPIREARLEAVNDLLAGKDVDLSLIDPVERQRTRADLLNLEGSRALIGTAPEESRKIYEAVIGADDTLPRRFLGLGDLAARPVGRIVVQQGGQVLYGTGSLISQRVLITNHHVLQSADDARNGVIELGYYEVGSNSFSSERAVFPLDPDTFFWTNEALDYSLVAVRPQAGAARTAPFGKVDLLAPSGKALIGERVNIIHHPGGKPQSISIRENRVADTFDQWIHYVADTSPGSSGAAVYNDEWQLVALHHASVPDGQGGIVNEGIKVSAIVQDISQSAP